MAESAVYRSVIAKDSCANGAGPLRSRHPAPAAAGRPHHQHAAGREGQPVGISLPAPRARARGVADSIEGYTALIDQQKAGFPVNVFVSITLDRQSQAGLEAFESAVRKVPEVMECYLMTGEHDYLLRLVVADMADFERMHNQHLTRLPSVARVHSSFAMRTVTSRRRILPAR